MKFKFWKTDIVKKKKPNPISGMLRVNLGISEGKLCQLWDGREEKKQWPLHLNDAVSIFQSWQGG